MEIMNSFIDFTSTSTTSTGGGSSGTGSLSPQVIKIIEQNTQHQTDYFENYKEIQWENGIPTSMKVWEDSTKTILLWDYTYTFTGNVPTQIQIANIPDAVITQVNITWDNGLPVSIQKTVI